MHMRGAGVRSGLPSSQVKDAVGPVPMVRRKSSSGCGFLVALKIQKFMGGMR